MKAADGGYKYQAVCTVTVTEPDVPLTVSVAAPSRVNSGESFFVNVTTSTPADRVILNIPENDLQIAMTSDGTGKRWTHKITVNNEVEEDASLGCSVTASKGSRTATKSFSVMIAAKPTPVEAVSSLSKYTPLSAYTLSSGNVTTYGSVNGNSVGYISGKTDLCKISEIYSDRWVKVAYPTSKGSKIAYCKLSDFIQNPSYSSVSEIASSEITVYRRSAGADTIGSVYANDNYVVVSEANGRKQIIYPVSGGYKLGWIIVGNSGAPMTDRLAQLATISQESGYPIN